MWGKIIISKKLSFLIEVAANLIYEIIMLSLDYYLATKFLKAKKASRIHSQIKEEINSVTSKRWNLTEAEKKCFNSFVNEPVYSVTSRKLLFDDCFVLRSDFI